MGEEGGHTKLDSWGKLCPFILQHALMLHLLCAEVERLYSRIMKLNKTWLARHSDTHL